MAVPVDHVNAKIFAAVWEGPLSLLVEVFQRWIQQEACPELLIDVADYSHLPAGPGIILVGHEANYSLDFAENRPGLLYNRKAPLSGQTAEKIRQAWQAALWACRRLEQEPLLGGRLRFHYQEVELIFNDRLLVPNDEATYRRLEPDIRAAFPAPARLVRRGTAGERLRVGVCFDERDELR